MKNGTPSAPLKCFICRFSMRPTDPVQRHATDVMVMGVRTTISPLSHVECIARVERQRTLAGWNGPKEPKPI